MYSSSLLCSLASLDRSVGELTDHEGADSVPSLLSPPEPRKTIPAGVIVYLMHVECACSCSCIEYICCCTVDVITTIMHL